MSWHRHLLSLSEPAQKPNRPPVTAAKRLFCAWLLLGLLMHQAGRAQLAPGPYELLPFADGFILEAFKDLNTNSGAIADWSGWSGTAWVSPDAYDNHAGTDFALQTGTPLYAAVAGTVTQVQTGYARDQHDMTHGNYVKIAVDGAAPNGELLDLLYAHMLSVSVAPGQRVSPGQLVGLSDNTGNSTSEHLHFQSEIRGLTPTCPFYWAHFKYPLLFNPAGTLQLGHVVRVTAISTPIRADRFDTGAQLSTAWQHQLYFSSYSKRGYYQIFLPNNSSRRSGWLKATDVEEVFTGTVIQALPDPVAFVQTGQIAANYPLLSSPNDAAGQVAQILFGGGRFVADQVSNGYYRIPVPGSAAAWGWVKPDNRMVVYPQLTHPSLNLSSLTNNNFPIRQSFSTLGKSMFGRPKFKRCEVKSFSPASPGGDGKALFLTDEGNHGDGSSESVLVGKPGHRNYYVQCDVYFNYGAPSGQGYERYGIFLRDDGFAGLDTGFEGAGNSYALLWDTDDGRLRAAKLEEAAVNDLLQQKRYITSSGWHTLRIEARNDKIKYLLDGQVLIEATDSTFSSGQCGIGYSTHRTDWPTTRGAYFDNFTADSLDTPPRFDSVSTQPDGKVHLLLRSDVATTNLVEQSSNLTAWTFFTNVINTNATAEFSDETKSPSRFYRARRLP